MSRSREAEAETEAFPHRETAPSPLPTVDMSLNTRDGSDAVEGGASVETSDHGAAVGELLACPWAEDGSIAPVEWQLGAFWGIYGGREW